MPAADSKCSSPAAGRPSSTKRARRLANTPIAVRCDVTQLQDLDRLFATIERVAARRNAEEIAAAITVLASDASNFVNGTNLVVDGGQTEVV